MRCEFESGAAGIEGGVASLVVLGADAGGEGESESESGTGRVPGCKRGGRWTSGDVVWTGAGGCRGMAGAAGAGRGSGGVSPMKLTFQSRFLRSSDRVETAGAVEWVCIDARKRSLVSCMSRNSEVSGDT